MTNEELTAAFPECERIKREQVAPFVEQVFNEVESWRQIDYKIKGLCQKLWPKPEGVKWEDSKELAEYITARQVGEKLQQAIIDKACKWIERKQWGFLKTEIDINEFRKAMEE